jgi:alpha-tubulin suppressor-like RCC1 family protein
VVVRSSLLLVAIAEAGMCVLECEDGYYVTDGGATCSACPGSNCGLCSNATTCTACDTVNPTNGTWVNAGAGTCGLECDDGYYSDLPIPLLVVNSGLGAVCVVLADCQIKCWGPNDEGQLGTGDTASRGGSRGEMGLQLTSVDVGGDVGQLSVGMKHTCAMLDTGQVKCWGWSWFGQLGQGDTDNRGDAGGEMGANLTAVDLGDGRTAVQVVAGGFHTCALLDAGQVKCWGPNTKGQLGQGDTLQRGDDTGEMGTNLVAVDLGPNRTARGVGVGISHT